MNFRKKINYLILLLFIHLQAPIKVENLLSDINLSSSHQAVQRGEDHQDAHRREDHQASQRGEDH